VIPDSSVGVGPEHLGPTAFIDSDDPAVRAFARRAVDGATEDRERIRRLFAAVRDEIRYDPYSAINDPADYVASNVIERGSAYCIPRPCCWPRALARWGFPLASDSPTCAITFPPSDSDS
jgi:Transglutaminase-like superfamily